MFHIFRVKASNVSNPETVRTAHFSRVDHLIFAVQSIVKFIKVKIEMLGVVVGCYDLAFMSIIQKLLKAKFPHSSLQNMTVFHVSKSQK